MKKTANYIVLGTIAACFLCFASCKSTKKKDAGAAAVNGGLEVSASEETDNKASEGEEAPAEDSDKKETAKKDTAKKETSEEAPANKDAAAPNAPGGNFTGWIKGTRRSISEKFGRIQLKIKSSIGSYSISVLNEKDKGIPVLSTANEFATNAFYLKTSKKVYNLVTDTNVHSSARRTTSGAAIMYNIPEVAEVTVDFSCFASDKENKDADIDMIKVTATVKNNSTRNDEFIIKAVLDTVLGEAAEHHFYTYEGVAVRNEALYRTLQNQKWFVSKNSNAAMQLFFTGAEATTPDLVALANYSTLEKNTWEPDMLSYRAFDTVLSYNNSGVCAIWKPLKLAPSETGKVVFYLAFAAEGKAPAGEKFVYSKEYEQQKVEETEKETPVDNIEVISANPSLETLTGNTGFGPQIINEKGEVPQEIPTVDFYIRNMSKDHLTPEYIQSLLDRISALEEDSPSLNRQELLQLNTELDAILTYLRQQ